MSKPAGMAITEYFVLLALAEGPAHGQAIASQIIGDSVGGVYLRPSTLYSTLKSLEERGLIERTGHVETKLHRKSYRLAEQGEHQLAYAARMHGRAAGLAKSRLGLRY